MIGPIMKQILSRKVVEISMSRRFDHIRPIRQNCRDARCSGGTTPPSVGGLKSFIVVRGGPTSHAETRQPFVQFLHSSINFFFHILKLHSLQCKGVCFRFLSSIVSIAPSRSLHLVLAAHLLPRHGINPAATAIDEGGISPLVHDGHGCGNRDPVVPPPPILQG